MLRLLRVVEQIPLNYTNVLHRLLVSGILKDIVIRRGLHVWRCIYTTIFHIV